jgi:hypothetical protein
MTTRSPHKLNVNVPAGLVRGLLGAACLQTAIVAGFTEGPLAERWLR